MTTTDTLAAVDERVACGAARFDEILPGWYRHVCLARLDMRSISDCVAGQVAPHLTGTPDATYCDVVFTKILDAGEAGTTLGLDSIDVGSDEAMDDDYRLLEEAWRALILDRLALDVGGRQ